MLFINKSKIFIFFKRIFQIDIKFHEIQSIILMFAFMNVFIPTTFSSF